MKLIPKVFAAAGDAGAPITSQLNFKIPKLTEVLAFALKFFFVIAGLAALIYLVLGAFAWITSGGDKENVQKAQQKIQAAVVGLIILVLVLAIIIFFEQVVFAGKICFGITCDISIEPLIK